MRPMNATEILRLQVAQIESMNDLCKIGSYSESVDSYGENKKVWTYGANVKCGANKLSGWQTINGVMTWTGIILRVRLPYNTTVGAKDRIRFGGVDYSIKAITGKFSVVVDCESIRV
jgi:SPP1 family predicted phage head-tail adaptor